MSRFRTIQFHSDSEYAFFEETADWRHASNWMKKDPAARTITFEGDIDPQIIHQGELNGGEWKS